MKTLAFLMILLLLTGCGNTAPENAYTQISQEEAKERMDSGDVIILDVREQAEFDAGHIPGAVLLSVDAITGDTAAAVIPEKTAVVLVYCRSGNRSKRASQALADLGYSQVYEFGASTHGLMKWSNL